MNLQGSGPIKTAVIAVDPGTAESGVCVLDSINGPFHAVKLPNYKVLRYLKSKPHWRLAIETIQPRGMAIGEETIRTCIWIGRFLEAHGGPHRLVKRSEVKLHLCGSMQAKDQNIRQALIDRYGIPGTKAAPGLLYGFSADKWSALAIGITALETPETEESQMRPKLVVVKNDQPSE